MEANELKEALEKFGQEIDKKIKESNEKLTAKVSEETHARLLKEVKAELEPKLAEYAKMRERLDEMEAKSKRIWTYGSTEKPFAVELKERLSDIIAKEGGRGLRGRSFDFEQKTVIDMTELNAFNSTQVVPPNYVPGIKYDPTRAVRMRDLLSVGETNSNLVSFIQEYSYTAAAAVTTEGTEYNQEDFTLKQVDAAVKLITSYIVISENMLEDVAGLTSYITTRLPEKLRNAEDSFILSDATYGILTKGTAYSDNLADSNVQRIDVLVDACRQTKIYEYRPTAILLHPNDAALLKLTKDANGQYLYPWVFVGNNPSIDAVPIIESTAMSEGYFLVGDFKKGAQLFDRRKLTIEFSNANEDNFIKGMVTVRCHERIALAVYCPHAFVYGGFAAALAQGTA